MLGAQAGLSWLTVLKKEQGYLQAFDRFDVTKCAAYTDEELNSKLNDPGIVRNKLKVYSVRKNAKAFIKVQQEFGSFSTYLWSFVDHKPIQNTYKKGEFPVSTPLSDKISADLKKRGFSFVGTVSIYAYLQQAGIINDHEESCFRREIVKAMVASEPPQQKRKLPVDEPETESGKKNRSKRQKKEE